MGRRFLSEAYAERLLRQHASSGAAASESDLPDLAEEEVWTAEAAISASSGGNSWLRVDCWHYAGGLSRVFEGGASSAPVAIALPLPGTAQEEGEMKGGGEWVPPHEYLALERSKHALATSVLEGVGRTLKGRDMSRVRDAVWTRTGFFG